MWVNSCVIAPVDVSYSFFSVSPARQLFNRDTTAIFYRCSDGYVPTGPWPGFRVWGIKHILGVKYFGFYYCLKQTAT